MERWIKGGLIGFFIGIVISGVLYFLDLNCMLLWADGSCNNLFMTILGIIFLIITFPIIILIMFGGLLTNLTLIILFLALYFIIISSIIGAIIGLIIQKKLKKN